jgi:hypothetical protein
MYAGDDERIWRVGSEERKFEMDSPVASRIKV